MRFPEVSDVCNPSKLFRFFFIEGYLIFHVLMARLPREIPDLWNLHPCSYPVNDVNCGKILKCNELHHVMQSVGVITGNKDLCCEGY